MANQFASSSLGIILIASTAILLLYASRHAPGPLKRSAAALSLLTLAGGFWAMYAAYEAARDRWTNERTTVEARARDATTRERQRGGSGPDGNRSTSGAAGQGKASDQASGSAPASSHAGTRVASLIPPQPTATDASNDLRDCPYCPDLLLIEPGFFRMGPANGDTFAHPHEGPNYTASVPKRFLIGRTEVTVGQFAAFVRDSGHARPACGFADPVRDANLPVDCVSWRAAVAYVQWLSMKTGRSYRLPSETEWTFAARAGSSARYAFGNEIPNGDAHLDQRYPKRLPVGTYPANAYGLRDVHGSVAEMVADCWADTLRNTPADARRWNRRGDCSRRVVKDAHAGESAAFSRLSARRAVSNGEVRMGVGFRIMREM